MEYLWASFKKMQLEKESKLTISSKY